MNTLRTILVLMAPDARPGPALHRAMAYAHRSGATLHLEIFDHYEPIDYAGTVFGVEVADRARRDFLDERMKALAEVASGLADNGLRVECDVSWARDPARAIVARIRALRPDLVIKDIDCEPVTDAEAGRLRPSSVDWKLIRLAAAPLMLVHPRSALEPRRVMAAVDVTINGAAGGLNDQLLDAARACLVGDSSSLHLGSVFSCLPLGSYDAGFIANTWELMDGAHAEQLKRFASRHQLRPEQVLRTRRLEPADGIATLAAQNAIDLVVIGSTYHPAIDRLLFGSTAEALLRRLSCDVLLIKPADFDLASEARPKRERRLPLGRHRSDSVA